jgi:hypothetical protein
MPRPSLRWSARWSVIVRVGDVREAFVRISTGSAQDRPAPVEMANHRDGPEALFAMGAPWAIPTVECPVVASHHGAADLRAVYGLASAITSFGDASACGRPRARACAVWALAGARASGQHADCPRAGSVPS